MPWTSVYSVSYGVGKHGKILSYIQHQLMITSRAVRTRLQRTHPIEYRNTNTSFHCRTNSSSNNMTTYASNVTPENPFQPLITLLIKKYALTVNQWLCFMDFFSVYSFPQSRFTWKWVKNSTEILNCFELFNETLLNPWSFQWEQP